MRNGMLAAALGAAILSAAWPAGAQGIKAAPADSPAVSAATAGIDVLKGNWVRPDGGYTIVIKGIGPDGQLEAMYFNPNPLPFSRAQAVREGAALRVYLECAPAATMDRPTNSPTMPPAIALGAFIKPAIK